MANLKKKTLGHNYKYTELSDINDYIESIGETYYQFIDRRNGDDYIMTQRQKKGTFDNIGSPIRGCRVVQANLQGINNPAQQQGSALTYARRYSLLMAYGLATEDDDGASLTKQPSAGYSARASSNSQERKPYDYKGKHSQIAAAKTPDEVRNIFAGIPKGLQKYFQEECKDRVGDLESVDVVPGEDEF